MEHGLNPRRELAVTISISRYLLISFFCALLLSACVQQGIYHPVQSGETLGQIARAYGRSEVQLARVNGIDAPKPLQKGELLFIPGAAAVRKTASAPQVSKAPSPLAGKAALSAEPVRSSPKKTMKKDLPARKSEVKKGEKAPSPQGMKGNFSWPLQGTILRRFGDKVPFPCKGIEIAAPVGTPVLAAAAGRVIYSGDGISSFGNMIILRHDDDFYTVYAFTQKTYAKVGSYVSQDERIALSGVPPQGRSPRLYFELRFHKEPLDPTFYLP